MSPAGGAEHRYCLAVQRDSAETNLKRTLTFDLLGHHAGVIVEVSHHLVEHATWGEEPVEFGFMENSKVRSIERDHTYLQSCSREPGSRLAAGRQNGS